MSDSNGSGIIRIGRKGLRKFAFGEDGAPFEVDVVVAFQKWIGIDEEFRPVETDADGNRPILTERMPEYHAAAVGFVHQLASVPDSDGQGYSHPTVTTAEALDFIARLREQYDELASFFRPRSLQERASPATSGVELRFSEEGKTVG